MDIINNSNSLNNSGSSDVLKSMNSKNFQIDSDNNSSHSFNSISPTSTSLISTPSPSSTDIPNNLNVQPNENVNFLKQYGYNLATDSINNHLSSDANVVNGYFLEFNNHVNNYNGLCNNKNQNKNNLNNSNQQTNNRKKSSSNTNSNSVSNINSKLNSNNSTIPPGLPNYIHKSSIMVNGQPINNNNKSKNLRTLMNNGMHNNNKMSMANGEGANISNNNNYLYSPVNNLILNNLHPSFQQTLQQQHQLLHQQTYNNFHLNNGDKFELSFNHSNSYLPSSNLPFFSWSHVNNVQDHASTFYELFNNNSASSFTNSNENNPKVENKFVASQNKGVCEIGAGINNGLVSNNGCDFGADSLLPELSIPKRNTWFDPPPNSQLSLFDDNHTQNLTSNSAVNPVSTSATNAATGFENVWSNSALNSLNSWPDFPSFSNFNNNLNTMDSNNHLNLTTNDFDMKKLMTSKNDKLSCLLENNSANFYDAKGRSLIIEIMALLRNHIREVTFF